VAVEEIWLDPRFGALKQAHLSESLYKTYAERLGLIITRAEDRVGTGPLPDWAPETLRLAPGTTMGLVERRSFDQYGNPAEASRSWFDPARARYVARVP
jgi:GntR family transcriptional regulator